MAVCPSSILQYCIRPNIEVKTNICLHLKFQLNRLANKEISILDSGLKPVNYIYILRPNIEVNGKLFEIPAPSVTI